MVRQCRSCGPKNRFMYGVIAPKAPAFPQRPHEWNQWNPLGIRGTLLEGVTVALALPKTRCTRFAVRIVSDET